MAKTIDTTDRTIRVLAGLMTPDTLTAVIRDIEDSTLTGRDEMIASEAGAAFIMQLTCLVGEAEAAERLDPTVVCDGCGRGTAKIGDACDHCGEIIECDPRG